MRKVEIDLQVHKRIEDARQGFGESENAILRRLLDIDGPGSTSEKGKRAWASKGVTLPHGTDLLGRYSSQTVRGRVVDGRWVVNGQSYDAPSPAIQEHVLTKAGKRTNLDGWKCWSAKRPGDEAFTPIQLLKPKIDGDELLRELGI